MNTNTSKRAHRILEIAARMAERVSGWETRGRIEEMRLHFDGYAEPGYDVRKSGIVATGNWNSVTRWDNVKRERTTISDLPARVSALFEKLHIECEWSDEWTTCDECGKLARTQADSYSWMSSLVINEEDGSCMCAECTLADPEAYLSTLEGKVRHAVTLDVDPAEHGYVLVNENTFTNGWHPGMTDDPKVIAKELEGRGISRFLFKISDVGQFHTSFDTYVHESESGWLGERKDTDDSCEEDSDAGEECAT